METKIHIFLAFTSYSEYEMYEVCLCVFIGVVTKWLY